MDSDRFSSYRRVLSQPFFTTKAEKVQHHFGCCTVVTITLSGHLFRICYVDRRLSKAKAEVIHNHNRYLNYFSMHHVKSLNEPFESKHISFRHYKLAVINV